MNDARTPDHAALLKRSLIAINQLEAKLAAVEQARVEPIAIVGMGCRFPGEVETPQAFWDLLVNGVDAVTEVPADRWDVDAYYDPDPDAPGKAYTRWGGFLKNVAEFDAQFFGISPREAMGLDPQQRLLLEVSWEAIENAGIAPSSLVGSLTAVYMGLTTSDYSNRRIEAVGSGTGDAYTPSGVAHSVAVGRLSYFFGLHGPNVAVDTACSSSMVALHWGVQSLRNREADLALAGGVNLTLTPDGAILTSRARMMSFDGRCKTFDASADGYVRGEGCGVLVLKRLSDAKRDGDRVLAVIRGSALNQDGRSSGLTAPSGPAQEAVIRAALANARLKPDDISFVEAHGTGTPLGDPIEVKALTQVFGGRPVDQALQVGSVKTNIGHAEAAAGVAGVIKTVLALQHRTIPPHLHLHTPNPMIAWSPAIAVPTTALPWASPEGTPRRAGISSFGFSGTNAHVVLEEAPLWASEAATGENPQQLLVLSAQTPQALADMARHMGEFLGQPGAPALSDVAATTALGRSHFVERLAVVAESADDARSKLAGFAAGEVQAGVVNGRATSGASPEIVFLFTGQGAQYTGMARQLFDAQPVFRAVMEQCDQLLAPQLGRSLLLVVFAVGGDDGALLDDTAFTQPALFAVEYALAQLWRSWGVEPTAVMGHSVGEYVAACIAGVFSLEDGLRLIAERGRLMSRLPRDGAMAAVFADERQVREAIAGQEASISIAATNGPLNTVISGRTAAVEAVLARFTTQGVESQRLKVSHAFHSPLMDPMLDAFDAVAATISYATPQIGLISNVSGALAADEVCSPAYWRRHLREAVRFAESIAALQQDGYRLFLEVGPSPTLLGMAQRCAVAADSVWIGSLRKNRNDSASMLESLAQLYLRGASVNWGQVLGEAVARRRVDVPTYPFQRERYWQDLGPDLRVGAQKSNLVATRGGHPMLGGAVASPLRIFQSEIGVATHPWLADHRIFDYTLFPATGFLELALAAAREVAGSNNAALQDVTIREGLMLPEQGSVTVQVIVTPTDGAGHTVQVFSRGEAEAGGDPTWRLHVSGSVMVGAVAVPAAKLREELLAGPADTLAVEPYYAKLDQQGAHYGPAFRGIESMARAGSEVLGRVRLPAALAKSAALLLLHPALLDACFQLVGVGLPWAYDAQGSDDICVPVGLGRYSLYQAGVSAAWCHVHLDAAGAEAELYRCDLSLFDEQGTVIAQVSGLELRRVTRAALQRATATRRHADWAFEVDWPALPAAPRARTEPPGRWLIVADGGGVAAELASRLKAQGAGVTLVHDTDSSQLARVLEEAAQQDKRPLLGVVSLASLDVSPGRSLAEMEAGQTVLLGRTLRLAQALTDSSARFWVVTRGSQAVAGSLPDPTQATAWGLAGVIASEYPAMQCVRVDLDPAVRDDDLNALFDCVWAPDDETRIAWRGGHRHVARLVPGRLASPGEPAMRLEITERGSLANLALQRMQREQPGVGQVEVRVHATGLNFRDVLNTLGMYPGDPGPLGNECAGVVTAIGAGVDGLSVGDEVISMVDRSFASYVIAPAALTVRKPASLSFVEAATIPVTFLTAQYALHHLAHIRPGDRVLIHAVTGGVGMAALQLARRAGAEIFGTAGTPAKRALALSLGVHHVADSRSLSFAADVMAASQGEGVDIVLNSLAGDFIPESLRVLRRGGRFIEIGKTGIWDATKVAAEFPGVQYHPLYLGEVAATQPKFVNDMLRELLADFGSGVLNALPHRSYPVERAENAFRYMGQGHHTGKIVVTQHVAPGVRADASYLITGGLGGLGLACAGWLVGEGARHLVLMGRHAPSTQAEAMIAELRERGAQVLVAQADVADAAQLAQLLSSIASTMPPLRGILHAAGTVDDAMLPEQTLSRFASVMAPKVRGSWNLHTLTAKTPLDFFVMFSAGAALLGSPGQGNYAAANSFLDALAALRQANGQHGLSISWGSWSGVGMAAGVSEQHRRRWASLGLATITPDEGVRMLQDLLYGSKAALMAALPLTRSRLPANLGPFFSELLQSPAAAGGPATPAGADILKQLAQAPSGERAGLLAAFLGDQVSKVLALGATHRMDMSRSLMDMGMDSLMAMELRNRIQTTLKVRVGVADLLGGPTLKELADIVLASPEMQAGAADTSAPVANTETWEEGSL